jgi:PilZ domain
MPDKMADRRVTPRYPIILRAELIELVGGAKLVARTSDLSRTGCYVDTRQTLASGSAIRIKLTQGSDSFEVQATVRYVSPGLGMGVQFEQIRAKQLAILDRWLEVGAKQPV